MWLLRLTCDIEANIVWNFVHLVLWHYDVLRQASAKPTQARKSILRAAVDQALFTSSTLAVVNDGLDYDPIADFVLLGASLADFLDPAAELMSEC